MNAPTRIRVRFGPPAAPLVSHCETSRGALARRGRIARRIRHTPADHCHIAADLGRNRAAPRRTAAATGRLLADLLAVAATTCRSDSTVDSAPTTLLRRHAAHPDTRVFSHQPRSFFVFSRSGCVRRP